MPQVIIVSNRLPVSVTKVDGQLVFSESIGGLATAMSAYANDRHNLWIGWPGIASEDLTETEKQIVVKRLAERRCSPVFLTRKQIEDYYRGYSNEVLWPLFHGLPFELNARHQRYWQAYQQVNQQFADAVLSRVTDDRARIWVHDYLLLLVPGMLRRSRPDVRSGFFLHIPFPLPEELVTLKEHRALLDGLLGAELVGLHTPSYVENFLASCQAANIATYDDCVIVGERSVRVTDFPIGIDYTRFAEARKQPLVKQAVKRYKRRYRGLKVIAATERLDISKGFVERLQAYRAFLRQTPELHGKVVFALVGAPSRTDIPAYQRLGKRVQRLVDAINTEFGTERWQPVDYISEVLPFEEVSAILSIADIAFIAPLKDGMNLVPKEFIASRRKKGVLILSETAGASEELQDALIVNPYKLGSLVNGLQRAFTMPRREQRQRFKRLSHQVSTNTAQYWSSAFMKALQQPLHGRRPLIRRLTKPLQGQLVARYHAASKRLLLFDYDGSLVPFKADYAAAKPPTELLRHLKKLTADPCNQVVIISGRSAPDLEKWFTNPQLTLIAEHGAMARKAGTERWQKTRLINTAWQRQVLPILETYTRLTPRAHIETKSYSLVWHYRKSPPYYAQKYLVTLKRILKNLCREYGLVITQGNKILEIKNPSVTKAMAISRWLDTTTDFVLAIGDDATDEDMFAALPDSACTIKVGPGRSRARWRLVTVNNVQELLRRLAS